MIAVILSLICGSSVSETVSSVKKIDLPSEAVYKKVLENGLILLIKESPDRDLVTIDIKIKAGSSLEGEYLGSGISHFVEHMLFKGTKTRKPGDVEREIKSYGGFMNGSTSLDLTSYYITVPSQYAPKALAVLKDLLLNAAFDKKEFDKEREVILKEIKLNADDPQSRLIRQLYRTAYLAHPYRYPPIGYEDAFRALTREDLIKYYNRMYVPNRIVVSVAGRVSAREAAGPIENEFKDFRRSNFSPDIVEPEPQQIGTRRAEEEIETNLSYLALAFHSTSVLNKDLFAMDVLSMILGRGNNSRLNENLLKNKRLVYSISSWNYTPRYPGLFVVTSILDTNNIASAEKAILDGISDIYRDPIKDEELDTAKRMVLSDYIFSQETVGEQAYQMGENEIMTGNYDFMRSYVDGIQSVTKDDIKRVAREYLSPDNMTVSALVPMGTPGSLKKTAVSAAPDNVIEKVTLQNGVRLLVRQDKTTPTISITAAFPGGLAAENSSNNGISNLTASMMLKGTSRKSESDIKGTIESRGGNVNAFSGFNSFGFNVSILKDDLDIALETLKDVVTDPIFPDRELEREKSIISAMIKNEDDNIFRYGSNTLRKELYGDSPYGMRYLGEESTLSSLKRPDLIGFYKTHCGANNMVISISGDIEKDGVVEKARAAFASMAPNGVVTPQERTVKIETLKSKVIEMKKEESLALMGFITVGIHDEDRYALDVLCSVLSGYSGRLFENMRDKAPLAYALGCDQKLALDTGYLVLHVATTKDLMSETRKALINEVNNIRQRSISADELDHAKRELSTRYEISLQTNDFVSSQSALDELYGLGQKNMFEYVGKIEKVTADDVKRVALKYLDLERYADVVIISE